MACSPLSNRVARCQAHSVVKHIERCGLRVMHHLQREHEVLACLKLSLNAASPEKARKYMLFKTVDACFAPAAHLYTRFARAAHDMNEP